MTRKPTQVEAKLAPPLPVLYVPVLKSTGQVNREMSISCRDDIEENPGLSKKYRVEAYIPVARVREMIAAIRDSAVASGNPCELLDAGYFTDPLNRLIADVEEDGIENG